MKNNNLNRNFGIVFFVVFLIIGLWPLIYSLNVRLWSLIISAIFLTLAFTRPNLLTPLNKVWIKLGHILGKFISLIFLSLIYFIILTSIGILLKIFNKDILDLKLDKKLNSYWKTRDFKILFKKQY